MSLFCYSIIYIPVAAALSRPQTTVMVLHFGTIRGSVQLFYRHMLILLCVTHDRLSLSSQPNPPFLALSATPKLQISPSWDWHCKPPAPCWRNYLCITLNLSINKRFCSQSVPKIPELQRKLFILRFVLFSSHINICWKWCRDCFHPQLSWREKQEQHTCRTSGTCAWWK